VALPKSDSQAAKSWQLTFWWVVPQQLMKAPKVSFGNKHKKRTKRLTKTKRPTKENNFFELGSINFNLQDWI